MKYGRATLAETVAQVVHFARDDYRPPDSTMPDDVVWNVSYICACFLAQHTVEGGDGVETEYPWTLLQVTTDMEYEARLKLAESAIAGLGGERSDQVEDQGFLVVADFPNAGRQIWRGGLFDDELDALAEFNNYVELNFNPSAEKPKFICLMPVVLRK